MKKRILAILGVFCVFSVFAQESLADKSPTDEANQEKIVLTIEDAVDYALKNSATIKSAEIDLEISKRANSMSWNTFLPSASINGSMSRANAYSAQSTAATKGIFEGMASAFESNPMFGSIGQNFRDQANALPTDYENEGERWKAVGGINLQLNFNVAMIESLKVAHKKYENGLITWEQVLDDTEVSVRKMFYQIIVMEQSLNIQKENLENAKARYEQAEINYANGLVPELSVLNSRVAYENQKPTVITAEQTYKQTLNTFAFYLGMPFGTMIELNGVVEPEYISVDADELFKKYASSNRDILSLQNNIDMLKMGLNAKRLAAYTPSLSVGWGYQPVVIDVTGNWGSSDNTMDNGSLSISLVYSNLLDILPFSANGQAIKDQKQQLKQLQISLGQLIQSTEMQVHQLVDELNKCQMNIENMERNVALATRAYNSTLDAYNAGTKELLDVKDAENSLSQSKLGLASEKLNYISALLDLESKLNINFKEIQNEK